MDQALHLLGAGEAAANRVASRQHRVVHAGQVTRCGMGRKAVALRCARASWQRPFPRVYVIGTEPPAEWTRLLAATFHASPYAAATGSSAAFAYRLVDRPGPVLDLAMVHRHNAPARPGVRIHRPRTLTWAEVRFERGVPVVAPARMLLALASELGADELEATVALAARRGLISLSALHRAIEQMPSCPGLPALRAAAVAPALTRSGNERTLLALMRRAELPEPLTNVVIEGKELDLYWPDAKLGVEVDAFSTHGSLASFEDDRRLDVDMDAADIRILRFTGTRLRQRPEAVAARIAAVLTLRLGGLPSARKRS